MKPLKIGITGFAYPDEKRWGAFTEAYSKLDLTPLSEWLSPAPFSTIELILRRGEPSDDTQIISLNFHRSALIARHFLFLGDGPEAENPEAVGKAYVAAILQALINVGERFDLSNEWLLSHPQRAFGTADAAS